MILREFYDVRLRMYVKRKDYLESCLEATASLLDYQAKFILEKCAGKIVVENKQRKTLVDELIKRGYPPDPVKEWKAQVAKDNNEETQDEDKEENEESQKNIKEDPGKKHEITWYSNILDNTNSPNYFL